MTIRDGMQLADRVLLVFTIGSAVFGLVFIFGAMPLTRSLQAERPNILPTVYLIVGVFFMLLAIVSFGLLIGYLKNI